MDKITKILAAITGFKGDIPTIFRVVILIFWGLAGLYTGSSTPVGDAVGIVTDEKRALAVAAQLLNDTPKPDIVEAVKVETGSPAAVVQTMDNIKPDEPSNK